MQCLRNEKKKKKGRLEKNSHLRKICIIAHLRFFHSISWDHSTIKFGTLSRRIFVISVFLMSQILLFEIFGKHKRI